jgi:hypothetical protein
MVNVQFTAPDPVTDGELQDALKPLGRPEATAALAPTAPAGTVTPFCGSAVTTIVATAFD